ncbi:regulator of chromosome condensation 1/beta-lactamase-inhibitor protein II [Elsinoe ampelina]|uniref:Regulator of chromosome condensation 1/beta-lactamase-inhibitor protein II n=1 Tax=Elsinoe ampelina TaxID=302913 RepID=A0A6A6GKV2_9PEZI|nr:regulator of chromosome condensation 1/beta-lactamase-inhibitor protein II [Elsinoe ampelina]
MAGVKYIKKVGETEPKKPATTRKAAAVKTEEEKPAANTKAKVTRKAATNGTAKQAPAAAKKTAAAKTNGATKAAAPKSKAGRPKKVEDTMNDEADKKPKATRKRKASEEPAPAPTKKAKVVPKGPVINKAPTQKLDVYVFGEGSSGELGLGTAKNAIDVKRPRLNPNLSASTVGVVQIATGGMHVAALTHDNKILTWGVNDQGALGRDTEWEGGLKDIDDNKSDDSSDDGSDAGLNPLESTPHAIPSDKFPEGTVFTQVAAGDSTTFALTDDGHVYGWGTFRSNEGIFGFAEGVLVQKDPILLTSIKRVTKIACGANHVLALDADKRVFAWGSGQQNQLGRRVVERTKTQGLIPREFGLPKKMVKDVECGQYHSFAIDEKDRVWSWGLNNYGETGISDDAGEDDAVILKPQVVEELSGKGVITVRGGAHHSIAVTKSGDCLTWGRVDGFQTGIAASELNQDDVVKDARGAIRILKKPAKVTAIKDPVATASASSDHCIAITRNGQAYSWGFSANYQTGLGSDDDTEVATLIDNTAVRGKKLLGAHTGGQFGILTAAANEDIEMTNGTNGVNGS